MLTLPLLLNGCGGGGVEKDGSGIVGSTVAAAALAATSAAAPTVPANAPIIFNASDSAQPGEIVTLQGARFGAAPVVRFSSSATGDRVLTPVNSQPDWLAVRIPADAGGAMRVSIVNAEGGTATAMLNVARAHHFDSLRVAPGGTFRIFGRNLKMDGYTPVVQVEGAAAQVDLSRSTPSMLVVTAPASLAAGAVATVTVDNGNGSGATTAERKVAVIGDAAGDPFGVQVGWTGVFTPLRARSTAVACNGGDVSAALQDAVDSLAAAGGGTVRLGAGTCTLGKGVTLRSNIIVSGAGRDTTVVRYTVNYPFWAEKLTRVALQGFTLQNGGSVEEGVLLKGNRLVVVSDVAFRIGRSRQMFLTENEDIVVAGSVFEHTEGLGQQSPYLLDASRGLVFRGNTTDLVVGSGSFQRVSDAYIQGNSFRRDALRQNSQGALHMMTIDFAERVAIMDNLFRTLNGTITSRTRNDGEAILTEGGGPNRTESIGAVASATATTLYDPTATVKTDPFSTGALPANMGVAIVSGTGAGQTRNITAVSAGTITVDQPWALQPDATSRYATFVWGLQKAIISGNDFSDQPRGIWLYQAAIRDVDVLANRLANGGGIYLRAYQNVGSGMFDPIYNVRIAGNHVVNRTRLWPSYITAVFVNSDARAFGTGMLGLRFIGNSLEANSPNLDLGTEEYAGSEGYFSMMRVENYSGYESSSYARVLGTIFQGNRCTNCGTDYRVGTGAAGTVISEPVARTGGLLWDNWKTTSGAEQAVATVTS